MEAQKKKTEKKDRPAMGKDRKPQEDLPKTNWENNTEENGKSRWNPCALYF